MCGWRVGYAAGPEALIDRMAKCQENFISGVNAAAQYAAGLPVNISQAIATFLVIRFLGEPLLEKLDRVKVQYGMMEDDDGI